MPALMFGQNSGHYFKSLINSSAEMPQWAELMYAEDPNVAEVDKLYREFFENHKWEKDTHVRNYLHWRRTIEKDINSEGYIRPLDILNQKQKEDQYSQFLKGNRNKDEKSMAWVSLGPYKTIQGEGSDRGELTWQTNVYSIDQSTSDPNILYCGAEAGGVFKTSNKGLSWTWASFDGLFRTVTAIQIHPSLTNTVFVGSSNQIWKTLDGGINWTSIYSESGLTINTIRIHPTSPNIILAGSNKGLLRSTDGGNSWTKIMVNVIWDIEIQPGNGNTVFAVVNNPNVNRAEFYKSTNGGASFTIKTNGWYNSTATGRNDGGARMTVTPADPNRIYVILIGEAKTGDNGFIGLYRSGNAGESWTLPNAPTGGPYNENTHPNLASINPNGTGFHQGYYNLGIAASHTDPDKVILGFLSFWKTEDGGASFNPLGGYQGNTPYIHPDQQELLIEGNDQWLVNDGGINYSNNFFANTISHESRTRGVVGSDYWGFGSGWNEDILVGGRYHNGNSGYRPSYGDTHLRLGGAEAPTGYVNPGTNQAYFSDINTKLIPLNPLDEVISSPKLSMYPHETYFAAHSSNLVFDPGCFNHFYIGRHRELWKSVDGGNSYTLLKYFPSASEGAVMPFEVSRSNPNVIYVYQRVTWGGAILWKSVDGGANWVQKSFPSSAGGQRSGTMSLDPENENILWVAFNNDDFTDRGKVYRTDDGGNTWTDLTTNTLDGHHPHDILYQAGTNGLIYLGTNKTVFYRDNSMNDWAYLGNGLPALTNVNKFQPFYRDSKLRMASYGAGIWEIPFMASSTPIIQPTVDKLTSACSRDTFYFDDFSMLDHSGVSWEWSISPDPDFISNVNDRNPKVVFGSEGNFSVTLKVMKNGSVSSKTIPDMVSINASECEEEIFPGNALNLMSSGDYASIPSLPINGNELTISAWVKPNGTQPDYTGIVLSSSGPAAGINFRPNMELGYHWPGGAWWWSSGLIVPQNAWSHVAIVVSPTAITVYLNEDQATHNTNPSIVDFRNVGAFIGNYQGWSSRNYSGLIDEVAIFDRALNRDEIRALRHLTKVPDQDISLVAYYQFNELSGRAYDKVQVQHASLRGSASRDISRVPVGGGTSQQMDVFGAGNYSFTDLGIELEFPSNGAYPDGRIVVSKLDVNPDMTAGPVKVKDPGYWIINNYGQPNFSAIQNIQFNDLNISGSQEADPFTLRLFTRESNDEGNTWNFVSPASSAFAGENGSIIFNNTGIEHFSQFDILVEAALATEIIQFEALVYDQSQTELSWQISPSSESIKYQIERAIDDFSFEKIGEKEHTSNQYQYTFYDQNPQNGQNYYRLKLIDLEGQFAYSEVRQVDFRTNLAPVQIYPNPLAKNEILTIKHPFDEGALLTIYDNQGKLLFKKKLNKEIEQLSNVFPTVGWYICEIRTETKLYYKQILIQ
jgi:photosystem II stability/assembly factor-like uncharacterized protein